MTRYEAHSRSAGSPRLPQYETGVERVPASRPTIGVALNGRANWEDKGIVLVNCDVSADTRANPWGAFVGCDLVAHLTLVELSDAGLDARGWGNFCRSPLLTADAMLLEESTVDRDQSYSVPSMPPNAEFPTL
jgi:hypothetical protein